MNYKLFNSYNLSISAKNIFNSRILKCIFDNAPGRSLNFMLKKSFNELYKNFNINFFSFSCKDLFLTHQILQV